MSARAIRRLCLFVALLSACERPAETPATPALPPGQEALESGQDAMRAGQFHLALDRFDQAAIAGARTHTCLRWKVRAYLAMGQLRPAMAEAKRLTELAPDDVDGQVLYTRLLLITGQYEAGWEAIARLQKRAPDAPQTGLLEVELLLALGLATRAEARIAEGRKRAPDLPEWDFHQAKVALLRHDVDAARRGYSQAARGGAEHGFIRAAWLHHLLGEPGEAERAYLDAAISAEGRAAPYSLASDFYAAVGRTDDAIRDLGTLQRVLGRNSPDATRRIATLLIRQSRHREAQQLLLPYLKRRMDDAVSKRELALSYLAEGKDHEARLTLEVVAEQDADSPLTQHLLGLALLRAGDASRADRAFGAARKAADAQYPARLGQAAAALMQRRWLDAEFAAREVLERQPGSLGAGLIWAAARKYAGQPEAAWVLRERLARVHPGRAEDLRARLPLPESARPRGDEVRGLPAELVDRMFGEP